MKEYIVEKKICFNKFITDKFSMSVWRSGQRFHLVNGVDAPIDTSIKLYKYISKGEK